jgi:hypothetical protein
MVDEERPTGCHKTAKKRFPPLLFFLPSGHLLANK